MEGLCLQSTRISAPALRPIEQAYPQTGDQQLKSRNPIDIAASRYGRRWVIGVFLAWLIVFELIVARLYGWSTPATAHDMARSTIVLLIGGVIAVSIGKRAEGKYKRIRRAPAL
jgi:hypothetical protein